MTEIFDARSEAKLLIEHIRDLNNIQQHMDKDVMANALQDGAREYKTREKR